MAKNWISNNALWIVVHFFSNGMIPDMKQLKYSSVHIYRPSNIRE